MENGWIKIHRKIAQKGYYKESEYVHLWIHLLLHANYEQTEFLWNGKVQKLERGQILTGRKKLSADTGINEHKIDRILKCLISEQQIEQQTTTKYRVITILNYNKYQDVEQQTEPQVSNKRATTEHIVRIKEDKKDKNNTILATDVAGKSRFNPLGAEILHAFEEVDPKNKTYYSNTTQRGACDYLLETYGLEEVLKRITVLPKTNRVPFFPKINSPNDLKEKWVKLQDAVDTKRMEIKSNNKTAF